MGDRLEREFKVGVNVGSPQVAYRESINGEATVTKEYRKDIKTDEAARLALKIFKDVLGDKFDITRFNVGVIKTEDKRLKKLSIEQIMNLE